MSDRNDMFLASAGRIYSRKTVQEEFTRYVYDCDVIGPLRSAIIRLYELPVKPINLEEFFAEYFENGARDISELSMLRAELCYKNAEAQDLMESLEKLNKEVLAVNESKLQAFRKLYDGQNYDRDETQYEKMMTRFFKDVQQFSPGIDNAIISKDDEKKMGAGESEENSPTTDTRHMSQKKEDLDTQFAEDIKKLDPWGIIFPLVHLNEHANFVSSIMPEPGLKKEARTSRHSESNDDQQKTSSTKAARIQLQEQSEIKKKKKKKSSNNNDLRDSKSLAELYHHQQQQERDGLDHDYDNDDRAEGKTEQDGHDWDVDYWKQFFKMGAYILPNPDDFEKLSMLSQWSNDQRGGGIPPPGHYSGSDFLQTQYFNTKALAGSLGDVDDLKKVPDESSSNQEEVPQESSAGAASRQYQLHDIWTAPKFVNEQIPIQSLLRHSRTTLDAKKTTTKLMKSHFKTDQPGEPDVIDTDISVGDPPWHCRGGPSSIIRTYSKALSPSKSSVPQTSTLSKTVVADHDHGQSTTKSVKSSTLVRADRAKGRKVGNKFVQNKNNNCVESSPSNKIQSKSPIRNQVRGYRIDHGDDDDVTTPSLKSGGNSVKSQNSVHKLSSDNNNNKGHHHHQKLSKIAQGAIVIPNYDGDGPKQIPFSRHDYNYYESDSEHEKEGGGGSSKNKSRVQSHIIKSSLSNRMSLRNNYYKSNNPIMASSGDSDCSQDTKSTTFDEFRTKHRSQFNMTTADPCDAEQVALLHPYPELLTLPNKEEEQVKEKKTRVPVQSGRGGDKFFKFLRQHYDKDEIVRLQQDFDFNIFEGML